MDLVKGIFDKKLVDDDREPVFSFSFAQHHVEVLAPNYIFFVQIIALLMFQMVMGCLLGVLIYNGMIRNNPTKGQNRMQTLLLGFGFILPFSFWLPFLVVESLDIRAGCHRLSLVSLPMTVTLSCLEAMYGFVPPNCRKSLGDYLLHMAFIMKPRYDVNGNVIPLTLSSFTRIVLNFLKFLFLFAGVYHIFSPSVFGLFPFPTNVVANKVWISFDIPHWYNTFIQATMMNLTLSFSMGGAAALGSLLSGIEMSTKVTDNPMFRSTSPSDFWGRRWNNLIHTGLKQGVYKPVRWHTGSATMASLAAFTASGLYHEFVWALIFVSTKGQIAEGMLEDGSCCINCYCDAWMGKQLVFFCWNGVLIALEYLVGERVGKLTEWLPPWLRSHLVVLMSLPVGHLFTADMTHAGYFESVQHSIPMLVIRKV